MSHEGNIKYIESKMEYDEWFANLFKERKINDDDNNNQKK